MSIRWGAGVVITVITDLHSSNIISAVELQLNTNHWAEGKGNRVGDISFLEMGRSPLSLYRDRDLNKTSFACKIFCKAPIKVKFWV